MSKQKDILLKYEKCINEILAIPRYKKKTNQDAIATLLKELGNPEQTFDIIHVAGTNGKGSICAAIEQIGRDLGYSMGMFTSPHLLDIRERFRVNQQLMEEAEFIACYEAVVAAKERCYQAGEAPYTFFETIFAMGMYHFQRQKVAYAIVEAGMGGASDTTNVVTPVVAVVASVGLDHTAILGETIEAIAKEKAGIIKPGVPVVVAPQEESIRGIFSDIANKNGADCYFVQDDDVQILKNSLEGIDFSCVCEYDKKGQSYDEAQIYHTSLVGDYQVDNIMVAMKTAKLIWNCSFHELQSSVERIRWAGRMELVAPQVYVDGAHNHHAIKRFVANVRQYIASDELVLVYAVANDKDDELMLEELLALKPYAMIVTELQNSRKTNAEQVVSIARQICEKNGGHTQIVLKDTSIAEVLTTAQAYHKTVFCVGSLYLVADIKAYFK